MANLVKIWDAAGKMFEVSVSNARDLVNNTDNFFYSNPKAVADEAPVDEAPEAPDDEVADEAPEAPVDEVAAEAPEAPVDEVAAEAPADEAPKTGRGRGRPKKN